MRDGHTADDLDFASFALSTAKLRIGMLPIPALALWSFPTLWTLFHLEALARDGNE